MDRAADIMTREVVTVPPDMPVRDVADLLASHRFGSVPVVSRDGVVLGIVTEEDLVQRVSEIHLPRHINFLGGIIYLENPATFEAEAEKILAMHARDIMDTVFAAVSPTTSVEELATRLLKEDLHRMLVLDADKHLLGIITRTDIVRMLLREKRLPEEGA